MQTKHFKYLEDDYTTHPQRLLCFPNRWLYSTNNFNAVVTNK